MSLCRMVRRCTYCHHTYSYNPSIGELGLTCKHCGKEQPLFPIPLWKPRNHIVR